MNTKFKLIIFVLLAMFASILVKGIFNLTVSYTDVLDYRQSVIERMLGDTDSSKGEAK